MTKILFIQASSELVKKQQAEVLAQLSRSIPLLSYGFASHPEELKRHDFEIIIAPTFKGLPDFLNVLPELKWIHFLSAGVDPIWSMDFPHKNYLMTKSSGVHVDCIPEFVLATILYFQKSLGVFTRQQINKQWRRFWQSELKGSTLGILGLGAIGRSLAQKASLLGMHVIGTVNAPRPIPYVEQIYSPNEVLKVASESDFVVVLLPLTPSTTELIGEEFFDKMPDHSIFINVARGEIVKESALIDALINNRIGGAALDVFDEEPLPENSPLWELENVLITPHIAGTTDKYMERAIDIFCQNYVAWKKHAPLPTVVDLEKKY